MASLECLQLDLSDPGRVAGADPAPPRWLDQKTARPRVAAESWLFTVLPRSDFHPGLRRPFGRPDPCPLCLEGSPLAVTIVAHAHPFVIGVDTHARSHTIAILVSATGEPIATEQFPSTAAGMDRAIAWVARRTAGDLAALWVIEGVATYGARLAAAVGDAGYEVVEA